MQDTNKKDSIIAKSKQDEAMIIEAIKQQKMQEIMQNINPELSEQIETLFNELSQKIYDTIKKNNQ